MKRKPRKRPDEKPKSATGLLPQHLPCTLAPHDPDEPCEGVIERAHWIKKQWLRDECKLTPEEIWHPAMFTPACERHHDRLDDGFIDKSQAMLPEATLRFASHYPRVEARLLKEYPQGKSLIERFAA